MLQKHDSDPPLPNRVQRSIITPRHITRDSLKKVFRGEVSLGNAESDNNPLLAAGFLGPFIVWACAVSLPERDGLRCFPSLARRKFFLQDTQRHGQ